VELLGRYGFTVIERTDVPSVLEFADPVTCARAMAATGPAFEAVRHVGEQQFLEPAVGEAETRVQVACHCAPSSPRRVPERCGVPEHGHGV
jgi:hypothetical protein